MKSLYALLIATVLLCSCGNKLKGKIENRDGKIYVVNTSSDKAYQFTIKGVSKTNDSISEYGSFTVQLAPGDEKFIGNEVVLSDIEYPVIKQEKPPFDPNKPFKVVDTIPGRPMDTIGTSNENMSLPDNQNPSAVNRVVCTFKVTGQLEIKNTIKYSPEKTE